MRARLELRPLRWLAGLATTALWACSIYTEDLLLPDDGAQGECEVADDCAGADTTCGHRTCLEAACGMRFSVPGTSCAGDEGAGPGWVCDGQGSCVQCVAPADCVDGSCVQGVCVIQPCDNGQLDTGEADVDCGGSCAPCPEGRACGQPSDCASTYCADGVCCDSACGGPCVTCALAGTLGRCSSVPEGQDPDDDCGLDVCEGTGTCRCQDNGKNGDETDRDCGGPACDPCADGLACLVAADCQSGVCEDLDCQPPTCIDDVTNGDETDEDCGGPDCPACVAGRACAVGTDCESEICEGAICSGPVCGDEVVNGEEECDDGNTDSYDACSARCGLLVQHLLISEVMVGPTEAEFIEIYNPTGVAIDLSEVYLADYASYYRITTGESPPGASDFRVRFPAGAMIAAGDFVVVAVQSATELEGALFTLPDFDLDPSDPLAPAMVGEISTVPTLTNTGEMLVLFRWDGASNLVQDLDYLRFGATVEVVDKTGVSVGGQSYLPDTAGNLQKSAAAPANAKSIQRCDTSERSEKRTGGNGSLGHDETSEDGAFAFKISDAPTPGGPPAIDLCP